MGKTRDLLEQHRAEQDAREAGELAAATQNEARADDSVGRAIRVADDMDRQRAQREARRRLDAEERGPVVMPEMRTLRERLSGLRVPVAYRIAEIQPRDTRVMLAAQFKAGKTTLVGNVLRALVDGDPFLNSHTVTPVEGAVLLIDTEMSERQLDAWLEAQGIRDAHRVIVVALRGRVAAFNLLEATQRTRWVEHLRMAGVAYVVLDCLRPILDALGLDEHKDVGRFLVAFDALLNEAGVTEALIVHHMGHSNERARGDSRIRDWPDVEWRLVRQDDNPASPRYFSAYGRDVEIPESALHFEQDGRRLSIGAGSRKDAAAALALEDVLGMLDGDPLSGRAIEAACKEAGLPHGRDLIRAALDFGIQSGAITTETGARRAILHRRATSALVRESARPVRENTVSECAAAYIEPRTHTHSPTGSSARAEVTPFDPRPFVDANGRPTSLRPA